MPDNIIHINDQINRKDLEIILEVNKKAVEIETVVADQNEEVISLLSHNRAQQETIEEQLNKIIEQNNELSKDLFKLQVLFVTGLLSLVIQIIEIFIKK